MKYKVSVLFIISAILLVMMVLPAQAQNYQPIVTKWPDGTSYQI